MLTDGEHGRLSKTTDYNGTSSAILTKANLIEEVSRVLVIPRKEAAVIVECILDGMVRAIDRGDKVEIRGFGSFRTRQRRARIGRNPKTGARVEVPAKRIPFFKPSRELRKLVEKI
jgi:integration host factor subunit beta